MGNRKRARLRVVKKEGEFLYTTSLSLISPWSESPPWSSNSPATSRPCSLALSVAAGNAGAHPGPCGFHPNPEAEGLARNSRYVAAGPSCGPGECSAFLGT